MLVSVIIVNYNTFKLTSACISSVIKYTAGVNYEIILVDNASDREDPGIFLSMFPSIKLVINPENNGFAKGNNLGIEHANGDVILLLNSDTYLSEDSISKTAAFLNSDHKIGILSAKLVYEDGKYQSNARRFRSIRNEMLDVFRPLLKLMSYEKRAKLMLNQYFRGDMNLECDWVSGAFMMFRRELLNKLPNAKLDDRFFMYGEDQLWCYQVIQAGFYNYFYAGTTVVHIANASTEPAKQLNLQKTMVARELEIMRIRKGRSIYYHIFCVIYLTKQSFIYNVKTATFRLFKYRLR